MTRTYRYGYGDERLTLDQLNTRWTWAVVHPEIRRRHIALFNYAQDNGHDIGVGGGGRSTAAQEAEFYRRHTQVACPGQRLYKGKCYNLKAGMAPVAPPGSSNHEDDVYEGYAIAIDLVGWEDGWVQQIIHLFHLKTFKGVNLEPWHTQPVEFGNSRSAVNADIWSGKKLGTPALPGDVAPTPPDPTPTPPPSSGDEDDMHRLILIDSRNGATYLSDGVTKSWVNSGNTVPQIGYRVAEAQGQSPDYTKPAPPIPASLPLTSGRAIDGFRYCVITNGNPEFIASYGPIVGPKHSTVDQWGR